MRYLAADDAAASSAVDGSLALARLPPMPSPNAWTERLRSVAIVLGAALIGQCLVRGLSSLVDSHGAQPAWLAVRFVANSNVVIALVGLVLIQLKDPGVIERSSTTCRPLPPAVATRLHANQPLSGLSNQNDAEGRSTFCVRCCVWRPSTSHHCSICQRCIREHDHHCAIFGRCVGGQVRAVRHGNRLLFLVNVGNLVCAGGTAAAALAVTTVELIMDSVTLGMIFALLVAWPSSALAIAYLRHNWTDIASLLFRRGSRRVRKTRRSV